MTVGQIKKQVAAYLQNSVSSFVVDGMDLLLHELNAARRQAELLHDFSENLVYGQLSVDPDDGGSLDSVVLVSDGTTAVNVRSVQTYYLRDTTAQADIPLYHHPYKNRAVRDKWKHGKTVFDYTTRYRDDAGRSLGPVNPEILQSGRTVYLHPTPSEAKTIRMHAYKWMTDYDNDNDTDWMTEDGPEYLKWAAIVNLNFRNKHFVPRQEGNLSPPEKARDQALSLLISNDIHQLEDGRQPYAHH